MTLRFCHADDLQNVWGHTTIGASRLRKLADCEPPPFRVSFCRPLAGGGFDVFGVRGAKGIPWQVLRANTDDGTSFRDVRVVLEGADLPKPPNSEWAHTATVSYSPELERYLVLKNSRDYGGSFDTHAFVSGDGERWEPSPHNSVYREGDNWGAMWSPAAHRFICYNKGVVREPDKPLNELIRDGMRTVSVRTSRDGLRWTPDDPNDFANGMQPGFDFAGVAAMKRLGGPLLAREHQITRDELDPPDLEFYVARPFLYRETCFLQVLNYVGSFMPPGVAPVRPDGHGPGMLDTEWWISRDGLRWDRPFRGMHAGAVVISHNPLVADGMLRFHQGNEIWGIGEDRLTYVQTVSNGVFETRTFTHDGGALRLNATVPAPGVDNGDNRAYLMAEIVDGEDRVVPGYEKERCIVQGPMDAQALPLRWGQATGAELEGRPLRLRFYFQAALIYAVSSGPQET